MTGRSFERFFCFGAGAACGCWEGASAGFAGEVSALAEISASSASLTARTALFFWADMRELTVID